MTYAAKARAHALAELEQRGLSFASVHEAIRAGGSARLCAGRWIETFTGP